MSQPDTGSRRTFASGELICSEGEFGDCAYIIERGRVAVSCLHDGASVPVANLGEGEIFGEMALIDDSVRSATAVAAEETEVFVIDRDLLQLRMEAADPVIRFLMHVLLERFRASQRHIVASSAERREVPRAGRRSYGEFQEVAIGQFKFEHELKDGIASGQLVQTLQPIVRLSDHKPAGMEALTMWQHPERGLLSPSQFIDVAESSGLVRELDLLGLQQACRSVEKIGQELGEPEIPLFISVNLSGSHFDDDAVVGRVKAVLDEEAYDPNRLRLEITEGVLVHDPDRTYEILDGLKQLGVRLALDDFGTGYSSLSYLHRFPIDALKIDQSFVRNMLASDRSADIVRAILALAQTFGLTTIAEGIDDERHIGMLQEMGCDYGQGYYFSKPLTFENAIVYFRETLGR